MSMMKNLIMLVCNFELLKEFIVRAIVGIRTKLRIVMIGMYSKKWYPKDIINVKSFKSYASHNNSKEPFYKIFNIKKNDSSSSKIIENTQRFLNKIFTLDQFLSQVKSENHIVGQDIEEIYSIHRFQFIQEKLAIECNLFTVQSLYLWYVKWKLNHNKNSSYAYSPYTVSERIVNLVILEIISDFYKIESSIKEQIRDDISFLKNNLEYPASELINNHILNNARALFIGGLILDDQESLDLSYGIYLIELKKMIDENGFLNENSTHYQLLITKNILEVYLFAISAEAKEMIKLLSTYVKKLVYASRSIAPKSIVELEDLPWIGDISPDVKTSWFDPNFKLGYWERLWNVNFIFKDEEEKELKGKFDQGQSFYSIEKDNWFLICNTHQGRKNNYPAMHGHADWSSFCLYYLGRPVFIDNGRLNYLSSNQQKKSGFHSVMLQNGLPAVGEYLGLFSCLSKIDFKKIKFHYDEKSIAWNKINHWQRKVSVISESKVRIENIFYQRGIYETTFNLSYKARLYQKGKHEIELKIDDFVLLVTSDIKSQIILKNNYQTLSYGCEIQNHSIYWRVEHHSDIQDVSYIIIERIN